MRRTNFFPTLYSLLIASINYSRWKKKMVNSNTVRLLISIFITSLCLDLVGVKTRLALKRKRPSNWNP